MASDGPQGQGYWAGMPGRLKLWLVFWVVFYAGLGGLAWAGYWWATLLVFLPLALWLLRVWIIGEIGGAPRMFRKNGVFDYTLDHIWGSASHAREISSVIMVLASLGVILWLGTEDMREEAAKPTLTERATGALDATKDKAGETAAAVRETTGGWIDTAKGWFD